MQFHLQLRTAGAAVAVVTVLLGQGINGQSNQGSDAGRLHPRATPTDYQSVALAGAVTIAADFEGHSVATPQAILSNADYLTVEVGLFGPAGTRLKLSIQDFSLRINGKKSALPAQQFGLVFKAIKDPEWVPPGSTSAAKSKGSFGGGGDQDKDSPPPVIHVPIELERAMELKVQKAALPEGERALPEAGLLFFEYGGKISGVKSVELIYSGPAGKAVLPLQ